ncbi:MAG: glycosyltransferase [Acutalibacteraceae bacterium]
MKKVLIFSESLDGGGAEAAITQVVRALDKDFFDITVVSETDGELHTDEIRQLCRHTSFIHKNKSGSFVREALNRIVLKGSVALPADTVRRLYFKGKYDIEVAACEGYSTKIIAHSHNKNSVKIAYIHTDFINNPWSERVYKNGAAEEKECYQKFDRIVCVSQTIKDAFVKKYGMADKVSVIYNIIDDEKIRRLSLETPDLSVSQRPLFALTGNFLPVKGYDRLVRAAARLRDGGYRFSVIIMGRDYQREPIEKLVEELDLDGVVTLLDFQKNPFCLLKNADCYVCSSLAEGYSTAVSEAIILGLPVITTDCSGMKEIFGDDECGIICENSEDGIYGALKEVLDNPQKLTEFAENSRRRAEDFSLKSRAQKVNEFYKSL